MERSGKLIVMPLKPAQGQVYNGTGLGIHFFLGNIIALHDRLTEFWFGWRVKQLFPEKEKLQAYCRGRSADMDFNALGKSQGIRYWLSGTYKEAADGIRVFLTLSDTVAQTVFSCEMKMDTGRHFETFYTDLFSWFGSCGLPFSEAQASRASWPEKIDAAGLDLLGKAVETTYLSYIEGTGNEIAIPMDAFKKSVAYSPESFLAHDLYAWALVKNKSYTKAEGSFCTALEFNKNGLGALAGLMWCAVFTGNRRDADKYALAKADARNDDPKKAAAFVEKKFNQDRP